MAVPNGFSDVLTQHNGQVVKILEEEDEVKKNTIDPELLGSGGGYPVSPLDNMKNSKLQFIVPREWLAKPSKKEIELGKWLEKTLLYRNKYSARKFKIFNYKNITSLDRRVLNTARNTLKNSNVSNAMGMGQSLEGNYNVDDWLIATDILKDMDYDTTALETILNNPSKYIF